MKHTIPDDRYYTEDHEWAKRDDNMVTIGITSHAQDALGDVVYVDLPPVGRLFNARESFGTVESVKAVSDLFMPISGTIVEVNQKLIDDPQTVNHDPHGTGWMIKVKLKDDTEFDQLLDATHYEKLLKKSAH